jgi:group I intron endonuclease
MTSGIYRLTIGNRYYYGSSSNVENRVAVHRLALKQGRHPNSFMQNCWNRHGEVQYEIVLECDRAELQECEQRFLDEHFGRENCLNLAPSAFNNQGRRLSPEHKAKIAEANRGRVHSEEVKAKIGAANRGRRHSAATKAVLSEAAKGRPITDELREKRRIAATGRRHTEESRRLMSERMRAIRQERPWSTKPSNSALNQRA